MFRGLFKDTVRPPPSPALWGCAPAARDSVVFKYKKGEGFNPLICLKPKRQDVTANRQASSGKRQKDLAPLSLMCQCAVGRVTNPEGENDGRTTEHGDGGESD
jgi:hypothetical protein